MTSLLLPIFLSAVALFIASFLSWMVFPFHRKDWVKLEKEDDFLKALRDIGIQNGSYMFPGCETPQDMKNEEYQKKWEAGPCGIITIFSKVNMGKNLGLTFLYFLVVSFCLGYLANLSIEPGDEFLDVFRFVATAGFMTFLAAIIQQAIWFHLRIIGHVIESAAYAAIIGAVFGLMWPAA